MDVPEWVKNNGIQLAMAGVGILMMGAGIWQAISWRMETDSQVEINPETSESETAEIGRLVIDVGGAVEKPGVYELAEGSRVNDALMKAGGLGSGADRAYLSRNMNLAQKLKDGDKIYIPSEDDPINTQVLGEQVVGDRVEQNNTVHINTATISELDQLWGVGSARAQQIIENRPYNSIEELVSKAKMPQSVIDNNAGIIQL